MAPPTFSNLGKKAKDLFGKQYDFSHSVSIKNDASPLSVDLDLAPSKAKSSFTYKDATVGTVETSIDSRGNFSLEATHGDAFGLAPGCEVKLNPVKQSLSFTTAVAGVALTGSANTKQVLDGSAVFNGADLACPNTNIGASAKVDLTKDSPLVDYNASVEYKANDFILGVKSSNCLSKLTWSAFRVLSPFTVIGVDVQTSTSFDADKPMRVGIESKFDTLTFKGKLDVNGGIVSTSISHNIPGFNCKAVVASQVDLFADDLVPKNIGVGLTF